MPVCVPNEDASPALDRSNPVESRQRQHDLRARVIRNAAPAQTRISALRYDPNAVLIAVSQYGGDLGGVLRLDDCRRCPAPEATPLRYVRFYFARFCFDCPGADDGCEILNQHV